ncbi:hypothetical protein Sjap_019858 [Stephania japonica]|uniref:SRP54-type proteins GTP-binding domain-containing protein n=1 Tax=Stephania japonica TaxID=461633 RepID=A0AAP0F0A0_9MAGN
MQDNMKKNTVNLHDKRKIIKKILVKLQHAHKYAYYHNGNPAFVYVDTFRAGAYDQLKQNATRPIIPFYGSFDAEILENPPAIVVEKSVIASSSLLRRCFVEVVGSLASCYMESDDSDPVKIAAEGVERLRRGKCDLVIVDTNGKKSDLVIFVMDISIGQAAFNQAQAFKKIVLVGAVIVTKMVAKARDGDALDFVREIEVWRDEIELGEEIELHNNQSKDSGRVDGTDHDKAPDPQVAATKNPVIFLGAREHMDKLEVFDVKPFVSHLFS